MEFLYISEVGLDEEVLPTHASHFRITVRTDNAEHYGLHEFNLRFGFVFYPQSTVNQYYSDMSIQIDPCVVA